MVNENIMLEAKNLILTKKLTELSDKVSELEKPTSRKKAVDTVKDAGTY